MAVVTENITAAEAGIGAGKKASGVADLIASARSHLERRRKINKIVSELEAMSDRELSDIGVYRCEIRRVARETL